MLALRLDLLPAAYCDELFKLLNEVKPFPYADVHDIVRRELGAAPDVVFRSFETRPFASASIGQVHRAELMTGEAVAVKVQRPHIREVMRDDIELMYPVARLLDWTPFFGATNSYQIIDEFAPWTNEELDYLVEARRSVLLYEHARDEPMERVARAYRGYTTSRLLTSELIEGIPLASIVIAVRAGDGAYLDNLKRLGYDLESIARQLDWNMLNQVYVFGYFHADLHPANLYVLPGRAIGYVDFGMIDQLTEEARSSLTRYSWLLFQHDVEAAVKGLMRWLAPTVETDAVVARQKLARVHQTFLYEIGGLDDHRPSTTDTAKRARSDNPYSRLAVEIMDTVRRHHLSLQPSLVAYLKMLMTLGTIRYQLAADYDLVGLARQFFSGLIREQGRSWLDPRLAPGRMYGATYRAGRAIELVEFVEARQPLLAGLIQSYYSAGHGLHTLYCFVVALGSAALGIGALLYLVLADPSRAHDRPGRGPVRVDPPDPACDADPAARCADHPGSAPRQTVALLYPCHSAAPGSVPGHRNHLRRSRIAAGTADQRSDSLCCRISVLTQASPPIHLQPSDVADPRCKRDSQHRSGWHDLLPGLPTPITPECVPSAIRNRSAPATFVEAVSGHP